MMPNVLFIDTNEPATNPHVVAQISKHFTVIPVKLQAGDINVPLPNGKLVIIERKETSDLLASIGDGRLFEQCERMVTLSPFSFIVVNGGLHYNEDDMVCIDGRITNWHGRSVRNAVLAVQMAGCSVAYTEGVGLVTILDEIISLCGKPDHSPSAHHERAMTFPPIDKRVEILSQFPGVGTKRAEALLRWVKQDQVTAVEDCDDFGELGSAIEWATMMPLLDESSHPDGWGKVTIANFRTALGLADDEYLSVRKDMPDVKTTETTIK
jgi:ERCC4-type nuclease